MSYLPCCEAPLFYPETNWLPLVWKAVSGPLWQHLHTFASAHLLYIVWTIKHSTTSRLPKNIPLLFWHRYGGVPKRVTMCLFWYQLELDRLWSRWQITIKQQCLSVLTFAYPEHENSCIERMPTAIILKSYESVWACPHLNLLLEWKIKHTVIYWFGLTRAHFAGMQFWIKDRLWSESPLPCRVHLDSKILKFFRILYSHHVFLGGESRYFNHTICPKQKPSLTENRCIDIKIVWSALGGKDIIAFRVQPYWINTCVTLKMTKCWNEAQAGRAKLQASSESRDRWILLMAMIFFFFLIYTCLQIWPLWA